VLVLVAFVVLVVVRRVSLVRAGAGLDAASESGRTVVYMGKLVTWMPAVLETAWALGVGRLAGLPPLT
jgi:hypothetical protein